MRALEPGTGAGAWAGAGAEARGVPSGFSEVAIVPEVIIIGAEERLTDAGTGMLRRAELGAALSGVGAAAAVALAALAL